MRKSIFFFATSIIALSSLATACGSSDAESSDGTTATDSANINTDLALHELKGNVKEVTKTTYFDVSVDGEKFVIDTTGTNVFTSVASFDKNGRYIKKENESIKRDDKGRIIRWEDHRPNAKNVPGGFLKDTIEYKYINGNHMVSTGMGQYAVVVFDDDNKIVGQYTVPDLSPSYTSAFNVYKRFDKQGNWIERVTIWSTQGADSKQPHVSYSIDRRDIRYY